jgi:hypothetical protein
MDEYYFYYKERLPRTSPWLQEWDIFLSAFNSSERVRLISERVKAPIRYWLALPEYHYEPADLPRTGEQYTAPAGDEAQFVSQLIELLPSLSSKRIVVDITGFISHYVIVLLSLLNKAGVVSCDVIYGEPERYLQSERTRFSDEAVMEVRQIAGFEGIHTTDTDDDLLILNVGFDARLVAEVANFKENARKIQLFGMPSLRPDMYQQGLLRAYRVADAMGPDAAHPQHFRFAPAHDPFLTASTLSELVRHHRKKSPRSNVYLTPLSTKAQALGFSVYYLRECQNTATSILYPFCRSYMRETSEGLSGAWLYHVELANLCAGASRRVS